MGIKHRPAPTACDNAIQRLSCDFCYVASENFLTQFDPQLTAPGRIEAAPSRSEPLTALAAFNAIWSQRWLVTVFVAAALIVGIVYLNFATYRYTVALRVAPVAASNNGLLGKLGGLASVAGLSLPTDKGVSSFDLYIESIQSPDTAADLARDPELMRVVFSDQWDPRLRRWHEPTGLTYHAIRWLKGALGLPVRPWRQPGGAELANFLEREVVFVRDAKKSIATIQLSHQNPQFSARLLNSIHRSIDASLRSRAADRSQEYIAYLTRKLPLVQLNEHREALARALGEEERSMMMASARSAYAAEPFGAVSVSLNPTQPKVGVVLGLAFVIGFLVGAVVSILRVRSRRPLPSF